MKQEYTPKEKEQQIISMVKNWYRNAKKAKSERKAVTDKCYKYYRGEQLTEKERQKKHGPKSVRNYIFSSVEDALSLLTDQKPSIDCWPRAGVQDIQIAEKTKQVLDWVWQETRMSEKLPMCLRDQLISGMGVLKVYFDSTVNYPYGEIAVDVVHPDYLFPDPDATSIDTCKYMIQATPTPLWQIRRDYPKMGKYVTSEKDISDGDEDTRTSAEINKEYSGSGASVDARHYRARLTECWWRDDATEEYDETDEAGVRSKRSRLRYPNGRRIVVAGDVLLEDGPNPFMDSKIPYVVIPNYEQTGRFWPLGDVEFLIETNNDINKIVSRLNDYIRNTAHTYNVYTDNCNIDESSLVNIEGVLVKISEGGRFEVHPPPNWPPAVFEWLTTCKSDLEIISGIREVLQGRDPKGAKSGIAFERLQEFALSRIRKKARSIDNAVIRLGELFVSRIKQFYTDDRQVRITGDFPIQQTDPNTGQPTIDPNTGQPAVQGYRGYDFVSINGPQEYFERDEAGNIIREVELDVVLEMGAAVSTTRSQDKQDAQWLFDKGIIDEEEVAKRFNVANYKEIEARKVQKQQEMMMMQAQANMQAQIGAIQGGGGNGPPMQ